MSHLHLFTSESVSEGHPDKLADQISDAILDECLAGDPSSRAAVETLLGKGFAVITGEVKTEVYVEIGDVVRDTILEVGYNDIYFGMDGRTCGVLVALNKQSPDIAQGVDTGGAGDQGMMFGYATDETPEMMPMPLAMAHAMMRQQAEIKRTKQSLGLRPDAKAQVTVGYDNGVPKEVETIVCSVQHDEHLSHDEVKERVQEHIIQPVLKKYSEVIAIAPDVKYHINPTGKFTLGGPEADSGLTGRKIIVDTYGGFCPHGGGAFSGKDPTKVDRSAAYMARHVAKCIVAAGLAKRAQVSLAYAIGVAEPVQVAVDTFGTSEKSEEEIECIIKAEFPFSPRGITDHLGLRAPGMRYKPTAKNGHFGNPDFPWEKTDAAERLK
ncbi:MAG: methionine adenosyltransferase [Fimbriimonadales bacterium]